ncbi:MAG TPA: carboxypeptidase regulatory-like domain-containing protein [Pyrinomonadaceae bacterium]|nr:carboxypeptidase regulatory-like domain-containing protein [Pyrinomonadaceae bacterium]
MRSKRAKFLVALLAALCLLTFSPACGGADDEEDAADAGTEESSETASLTPYSPTGKEGIISGAVNFEGAAPAPKPISMDQDPVCAQAGEAVSEDIVINGDKLQNVFVYISEGKAGDKDIKGYSFTPPPTPAVLDQKGCQYVPHVLGVQANQKLQILNSDPTSHNVNAMADKNPKFNQGQGPSAPPLEKTFARPETLIPVKCNQHPWMRAYIGVLGHPFFAVSGKDGRFEIKGVPPGTYTLTAWHEKYPKGLTQSVTVAAGESKSADFKFSASQLAADNSGQKSALQVLPALELPLIGHH